MVKTKIVRPCEICKGACCEYMLINVDHLNKDNQDWFLKHGKRYTGVASRLDETTVEIDKRCHELTMGGKCRNYGLRPEICKKFQPGNPLCIEAIRRQRDPDQARTIIGAMVDGN